MSLLPKPFYTDIATDVPFMLAYQAEGLKEWPGDGVVGLAPNSQDGTPNLVA